jgi:ADP-ribosyl-[dinitrogen reductase] hydrolase
MEMNDDTVRSVDNQMKNRIMGGILGVLVGDALGLPVQFLSRGEIQDNPITEMRGYGTFDVPAGTWSDDSSLTLCLVESLSENGYDLEDLAKRCVLWFDEGYLTPFDESFDIGRATAQAMNRLKEGISPLKAGSTEEHSNGNGSLMRILPAAIYFMNLTELDFIQKVSNISRVTHAHPRSQLGCCLYSLYCKDLLKGLNPKEAYDALLHKAGTLFKGSEMEGELSAYQRILNGGLPLLNESEIQSSGYVVDTLEAALWCLLQNSNFKATVLQAVNLGDDTDTVGAVTGGMAGLYYGFDSIPKAWVGTLIKIQEVKETCSRFLNAIMR